MNTKEKKIIEKYRPNDLEQLEQIDKNLQRISTAMRRAEKLFQHNEDEAKAILESFYINIDEIRNSVAQLSKKHFQIRKGDK